jgi:hypothetical protein
MLSLKTEPADSSLDLARRLRGAHWYFKTRIRSSFGDLAYVSLFVTAVFGCNVLHNFVNDQVNLPWTTRLDITEQSAFFWSIVGIPSILILSLALKFAPPEGLHRWLWAIGAATLGTLCGNRCAVWLFHDNPGFDHISQGFVTSLLMTAGCFLNNTVRNTEADLYEAERESTAVDAEFQRAQLDLLRAQIEPHFLFNTLATVRTLALTEPRTAALLIDDLLRYLTAALPKLRQSDSSLEDEIQLIDAYLRIQQVRMGTRLSYDVLIPDGLKAVRIPAVMLLTLVENAIKHGVAPSAEGGAVRVTAVQDATMLILRVIDDGRGLQAQVGYGSGLANVNARLALIYRDRASFSLEPGRPRGVIASIKIPMDATA